MTPVLRAERLTRHYGRRPALTDVDLTIPAGRVVGLVGPNGAGKSTLLNLAAGVIAPTSGVIEVLGARPASSVAQLARVGFVAQDTPVYASLSVADHLRLGERLNPSWDSSLANRRVAQVGLDPAQRAGRLSGGQRAQLALTLAAAKRPELLVLDEPVAALDPLARRAFLQSLTEFVAELSVSVILSSHLLSDLERVCDHLVVLTASRVQVAGDVTDLLATHVRLIGPTGAFSALPTGVEVIDIAHTNGQTAVIVRDHAGDVPGLPGDAQRPSLEDLVLAYLGRAGCTGAPTNLVETNR